MCFDLDFTKDAKPPEMYELLLFHIENPPEQDFDILTSANFKGINMKIEFDLSYRNASTKLIDYKGIKNKASWCPIIIQVIIQGKPETKAFAWNVGIGN